MKTLHAVYRQRLLVFSLAVSAVFLWFLSKSSPLYPMNDWVDVHCFFTMGRSILDGLVPYADLYEQKGPVLYFLYAIASLISRDTFWGVFLLEVASFGLFLFFSCKIAQLYLGQTRIVYLFAIILAAMLPISPAFSHGSSVEELCLFMLAYGMLSILRAIQQNRDLTFMEAFWNGVFAAMALWIKFTIVGFYIGLALFVLLYYLFRSFRWQELLRTIGAFLAGVAAVSGVVFLYFAVYGGLDDLFTVYFYNNLFLYPTEVEGSRWDLIWNCLKYCFQKNPTFSYLLLVGLTGSVLAVKTRWKELVALLLCFAALTVGTYWGGRGYIYYGFIFSAFSVFGLISVVAFARILGFGKLTAKLRIPKAVCAVSLCICLLVGLNWSYGRSSNVSLLEYEKSDMPQYRFAEVINTVENATILNYGFLDGGFYYAANVVPNNKFFCNFNINAPDMWDSQKRCIEAGDVDFIITRKYQLSQYTPNSSQYQCVDSVGFFFDGYPYTYYLYQKIS